MKLLKKWILPALFGVLALVAIILVPTASCKMTDHGLTVIVKGIVFGAKEVVMTDGVHSGTTPLDYGPSVLLLIGWILIILGLVCGLLVAFLGDKLFKDQKLAKIFLLVAAGLVLLGSVFQFFALRSFAGAVANSNGDTPAEAYEELKRFGYKIPSCTVAGVLGLLGALSLAVVPFLPEKKQAAAE